MPASITRRKINETAALLGCRGIRTLDDLRMCISQDLDRGIHWISINTGASRALLIALLIAEAKDEAAKKGTRDPALLAFAQQGSFHMVNTQASLA